MHCLSHLSTRYSLRQTGRCEHERGTKERTLLSFENVKSSKNETNLTNACTSVTVISVSHSDFSLFPGNAFFSLRVKLHLFNNMRSGLWSSSQACVERRCKARPMSRIRLALARFSKFNYLPAFNNCFWQQHPGVR